METVITVGGVALERVYIYQYLGRLLACNDNDWPSIQLQLKKAPSRWGSLSRVLVRDGATPRISGMFYKAVVQTVLLFGCEAWTITDAMWSVLCGFHHRAARRMANMMAYKIEGGKWVC